MAAPTLLDYVQSTWSGTGTSETTTANLDWDAAAVIVCLGMTEDNGVTLSVPTATGLTLAAVAGSPTTTASSCKGYGWSATAGSSGSSALSSNLNGNNAAGLAAWAFSGVSSLVVPTPPTPGAALTMSITVAQDSSVLLVLGDWNATADATVDPDPAGGTIRVAQATSGATFIVGEWHNQAAGTRSYGVANWGGTGTVTKFAAEVRGVASAAASHTPRRRLDMGALIQV